MKKYYLMALIALMPLTSMGQKATIENPTWEKRGISSSSIAIEKVQTTPKATTLYFKCWLGYAEGTMRIAKDSYILVDGKKLTLTKADGIPLDELFKPNAEGFTRTFSLTFPAVNKNTQYIDFIEGEDVNYFKFFNVPVTKAADKKNKEIRKKADDEYAQAANVTDDGKPLPDNKLALGTSKLKGQIIGYTPEIFNGQKIRIMCYINNPISGVQDEIWGDLDSDGKFEMELPLTSQYQTVGIQTRDAGLVNEIFLATIGGTVEFIYDIDRYAEYRYDKPSKYMCFKGDNADINNAIAQMDRKARNFDYDEAINFKGTSAMDFKGHIYELAKRSEQNINNSSMPQKAKEYAKIKLKSSEGYFLGMADYFIAEAYRRVHNINDHRAEMPEDYQRPEFTEEYAKYVQELNLNDMQMLYSDEYQYCINELNFLIQRIGLSGMDLNMAIFKQMMDEHNNDEVIANLYNMLTELAKLKESRPYTESEIAIIQKFNKKYAQEYDKISNQIAQKKRDNILGTDKGIIVDLMKSQPLMRAFESRHVLGEMEMKAVEEIGNQTITEYAKQGNAKIQAEIEADKARGGYFQHQTNETEADAILVDILKNHNGKVVYVDIWATWCGPCRAGIAAMKPHHEELAEKGVDFVYITDETSPEDEYNNMIAGMQGDHYRLTMDQMSKLKEKFHITGIPFYLFINKKGEVAETQSGWGGEQRVIDMLGKLMSE